MLRAEELKKCLLELQERNAQIQLFCCGSNNARDLNDVSKISVDTTDIISCDTEENVGYLKVKSIPGEIEFSRWQEIPL